MVVLKAFMQRAIPYKNVGICLRFKLVFCCDPVSKGSIDTQKLWDVSNLDDHQEVWKLVFPYSKPLGGSLFIKKTAIMNTATQKLFGKFACRSKVSHVSTICLCFLSIIPFCYGVPGQKICLWIPQFSRRKINLCDWDSPPPSYWNICIFVRKLIFY